MSDSLNDHRMHSCCQDAAPSPLLHLPLCWGALAASLLCWQQLNTPLCATVNIWSNTWTAGPIPACPTPRACPCLKVGDARGARLFLRAPWILCWTGQSPGTSHLLMPAVSSLFPPPSFLALARKSLDWFLGPWPMWDSWKLHSSNSKYSNYNYSHLFAFVYLLFQESSSSTQNSFILIEISSPWWFEESCADSVQQSLRKSLLEHMLTPSHIFFPS